jgi:serine/threonine-protein kinase
MLDVLLDPQATLERVCASCPEVLPMVRNKWQRVCRLRADLDILFPLPEDPTTKPGALAPTPARPTLSPHSMALPHIPGYAVEAELGRGGMGIVYRARHVRLNRLVALKMLLGSAYAAPQDLARFRREAEAGACLRHPHIVQVYDAGEHDGLQFFTMECLEGGSLAERVAGAPQPAHEAAALLATLSEAVHVAHECGIVHRDLKPGNIILTADGTPKITDFGLARHVQDEAGITQKGMLLGTPSYMAPEQAQGRQRVIGPAVDIYALGATLYELLTGRPPFLGETTSEIVQQVISQEPVPPSRLNVEVPRDLETICLKCLKKDPAQRYTTAAALADDLRRFQRGESIAARRPGRLRRFCTSARCSPAVAAFFGAVVLFMMTLIGGALWLAANTLDRHFIQMPAQELAAQREKLPRGGRVFSLTTKSSRVGQSKAETPSPGDWPLRLA